MSVAKNTTKKLILKSIFCNFTLWFKEWCSWSIVTTQLKLVTKLKGYLHYKTISSQTVLFEAQVKNFFFLLKSYVSFSRYLSFHIFNHSMIYQICDIMISVSAWDSVHFWIYLLNQNSWSHQTWPTDRCKQGQ